MYNIISLISFSFCRLTTLLFNFLELTKYLTTSKLYYLRITFNIAPVPSSVFFNYYPWDFIKI